MYRKNIFQKYHVNLISGVWEQASTALFNLAAWECLGTRLIVSYILIAIVEMRYTRKYHEFIAGYCYECAARVTIPEAMNR